jgi:hypothetical protein
VSSRAPKNKRKKSGRRLLQAGNYYVVETIFPPPKPKFRLQMPDFQLQKPAHVTAQTAAATANSGLSSAKLKIASRVNYFDCPTQAQNPGVPLNQSDQCHLVICSDYL